MAGESPQRVRSTSRRSLFGVMAGAAAMAMAEIRGVSGVNKNKKRKLKRCKQDAWRCKRDANAYCSANHPNAVEACKSDIHRCCRSLRTCNYRKTNRCSEQVIW